MNAPRPVSVGAAAVVAGVVGAVTYVVLRLWVDGGRPFPHPSLLELGALALIGATALVLGRRVRRMARGLSGVRVSPLTAARTFVLAQACVVTGAALAGTHTAQALLLGQVAGATGSWAATVRVVVLAAVSLLLAVVGFVVQRWCRRPDDPAPDPAADADDAPARP